MNNLTSSTEYYKEVLKQDNTHVEAIACIGSSHFYTDQPEIALRYYRSADFWVLGRDLIYGITKVDQRNFLMVKNHIYVLYYLINHMQIATVQN